MIGFLRPLWAYRSFVLGSVKREFQSKYRNSLLGAAWVIINPLAQIFVFTVIFSQVMRAKLPGIDSTFAYSIYLCAGTLTWGLFSEITTRSQTMFLDNAGLLKKLNFPRLCLPVTVVLNALLNFSIIFGLFTTFLLITNNFPGITYIALAPLLILLIAFAAGLGMILGVLNVFFRDVGQFFGIFITFWFWFTPIVYPVTILPERAKPIVELNPMAYLIGAVQGIVLRDEWPQWGQLFYPAGMALALCLLGLYLFRKHSSEMVDEL